MNLSAKVEYACIAVLELASHWGREEPLHIRDIADAHGIPSRFLVQILLQLKGAGLVQSTRGATGGYLLARDPRKISLLDVLSVIEGPSWQVDSNLESESPATRTLLNVWNEAADQQRELLAATHFAELAERMRDSAEEMYYI